MTPAQLALHRFQAYAVERMEQLHASLTDADEHTRSAHSDEYVRLARALACVLPALAAENGGPLLSTKEMAARLNVSPKTLLRRRARGEISAVQLAKRGPGALRWGSA